MSDDAKLDKLMDMMESMMISVDKSFAQLSGKVDGIERRVVNIETKIENGLEPKIDLALELIAKTSNYALEKRVTELERGLA